MLVVAELFERDSFVNLFNSFNQRRALYSGFNLRFFTHVPSKRWCMEYRYLVVLLIFALAATDIAASILGGPRYFVFDLILAISFSRRESSSFCRLTPVPCRAAVVPPSSRHQSTEVRYMKKKKIGDSQSSFQLSLLVSLDFFAVIVYPPSLPTTCALATHSQ